MSSRLKHLIIIAITAILTILTLGCSSETNSPSPDSPTIKTQITGNIIYQDIHVDYRGETNSAAQLIGITPTNATNSDYSYGVEPSLPDGVDLNLTNGTITVATNAPGFSNTYTITATIAENDPQYKGSVTGTISIKVNHFSENKQYRVRFYQEASLLKTISVTSLTTISALDYPVNPNTGKTYRWHSNASLGGVFNKDSLVVADFDLYAQEVPASFEMIIENKIVPTDLAHYGEMSEEVFSNYTVGATVVARYVKETASGTGDGSSWFNAANDMQAVIDEIGDANAGKIYVVLVASGIYRPDASYVMKKHVVLIGGFIAGSYDRSGETYLDGDDNKRVFNNDNNDLDRTAILYGMVVTNGNVGWGQSGGGMYNNNSSPTLNNVIFSGNEANNRGGGMHNYRSSSTLINVTFSGNKANYGGGINVEGNFSSIFVGGEMYNPVPPPTLINVTFSGNTADEDGGGMRSSSSSSVLINVTFSGNTADEDGGGIYHNGDGQPLTLINTILWEGNNGQVYLDNNNSDTEDVNLYYSHIYQGTNASPIADGIRLNSDDTNVYPISIDNEAVITNNPGLGTLANHGGKVDTIPIDSNSPVKNKGIYVRGVKSETENLYPEANLYYSKNQTDWYSDPGLTMQESPPNDADDLTATDARGYGRVGRPDMGAYEVESTP